jgi:hypothetical protein
VRPELTRLDLSARRRSLSGNSAGMALYALVVAALYPGLQALDVAGRWTASRLGYRQSVRTSAPLVTTPLGLGWLCGSPSDPAPLSRALGCRAPGVEVRVPGTRATLSG